MLGFPYGIANFVRHLPCVYLERERPRQHHLASANKPDERVVDRATRSQSSSQITSPSTNTTFSTPTTCLTSR